MTKYENEPQLLARRLLNTVVTLPTYPDTDDDTIGEEEVRLGDRLPEDLPSFLLATEMPTGAEMPLPEIIHQLKVLAKSVVKLSKTGSADRAILHRGEALVEGFVPLVRKEADDVRSRLSPDHGMIQTFRKSSGDEGAKEVQEIVYFQYLNVACAADTLDKFLTGLRDINAALAREPSLPPFP